MFEGSNKALYKKLKQLECQDSTMLSDYPLVLNKGQGSLLWDVENNSYIDLCAGFGALPLGHNHFVLKDLFKDSDSLIHGMGDVYSSYDKIKLMELLLSQFSPHFDKAVFMVTGGQAVEFALKTACLFTSGSGILCFDNCYHGLDLGVLPLVGRQDFRKPFEALFAKDYISRLPYSCSLELVKGALQSFITKGIKPAAIVVEPILGRGGMVAAHKQWLQGLSTLCKEQEILLIFDEVFSGLGRSGKLSHTQEVSCDILCLGKALGGGMPISACLASSKIMNSWPQCSGEALHTGTFFGHPLSARCGFLTLKKILEDNLASRSKDFGIRCLKTLKQELGEFSIVKDIRGQGLMIAVEFEEDYMGEAMMHQLRTVGVIAIPCGIKGRSMSITPALNISALQFDNAVDKIRNILQKNSF